MKFLQAPWLRSLPLTLSLMALVPMASAADALLIRGATLFDGTGRAPYAANVLVEDRRIAAIGDKLKVAKGAQVINAKGQALLPGLFDLHTHWTPNMTPSALPQVAKLYMDAGVTTVSDIHEPPEASCRAGSGWRRSPRQT